jgi:hypothetical protein
MLNADPGQLERGDGVTEGESARKSRQIGSDGPAGIGEAWALGPLLWVARVRGPSARPATTFGRISR